MWKDTTVSENLAASIFSNVLRNGGILLHHYMESEPGSQHSLGHPKIGTVGLNPARDMVVSPHFFCIVLCR
jgi:hypothetical protein